MTLSLVILRVKTAQNQILFQMENQLKEHFGKGRFGTVPQGNGLFRATAKIWTHPNHRRKILRFANKLGHSSAGFKKDHNNFNYYNFKIMIATPKGTGGRSLV